MEFTELQLIVERIIKKKVIRNGKRVKIKTSDKEGFKIQNGQEVKISAGEKLNRLKSSKKAVIKRKVSSSRAIRKRALSMKKVR